MKTQSVVILALKNSEKAIIKVKKSKKTKLIENFKIHHVFKRKSNISKILDPATVQKLRDSKRNFMMRISQTRRDKASPTRGYLFKTILRNEKINEGKYF